MPNRPSRHYRGYLYITAATFFWGISAALGRAVFTGRLLAGDQVAHPIGALEIAQTRATFAFLVLFPALLLLRGPQRLRLPRVDLMKTLLLGVLGVAASNYLYYLAIQRTNVATAIILQYTAPVWVLLYLVARGRVKPTLQRMASVALALLGIGLVIGIFSSGGLRLDTIGVVASLLAAFSFAFYNIGGHDVLTRYDRWTVLLYTTLSAAFFWMIVNPPWKVAAAHFSGRQWLFLLVFSLVSVLAPFSCYFAGLQYLDPSRAIVVSCLEPVFSILITAVALGELVRPPQIVGIALVLLAIMVVQMPERSANPETRNQKLET